MPRKSIFDQEEIKIEHLLQNKHLDIIEKKDCLGVSLAFNKPMCYNKNFIKPGKIVTIPPGSPIPRTINNSWKGLTLFLLAVAYTNKGDDLYMEFNHLKSYSYKTDKNGKRVGRDRKNFNLRMELRYSNIMYQGIQENYRNAAANEVDSQVTLDEALQKFRYSQEQKEQWRQQQVNKINTLLSKKFKSLPRDFTVDEVPVGNGKKIYAQGDYEPVNIQSQLNFFVELLDIDLELSKVRTRPSEEIPHKYGAKGAQPVWDRSI